MEKKDYLREAKLLFASGQLEQCIELFTQAYENGSDPVETCLSRGAAAMASSRYQDAEEDFSRVLATEKEHDSKKQDKQLLAQGLQHAHQLAEANKNRTHQAEMNKQKAEKPAAEEKKGK